MITLKQILKAYDDLNKEEIEKKLKAENEKIKKECNEHYTSYNRCYYLKYRPEDESLLLDIIKMHISEHKKDFDNYRLKKILNLQTRLEKNHIYWKLENK